MSRTAIFDPATLLSDGRPWPGRRRHFAPLAFPPREIYGGDSSAQKAKTFVLGIAPKRPQIQQ